MDLIKSDKQISQLVDAASYSHSNESCIKEADYKELR